MFLGPDRVLGVDLGAIGGAVLYGVLWVFLFLVANRADGVFAEETSFAEREAWVALVFIAFLSSLRELGDAADQISNPASRRFGMNFGMLIFGWMLAIGVLRARNGDVVELDERDLRIQHAGGRVAGGRVAGGLMAMMIIGVIVLLCWLPEQSRSWMRPLLVANTLLGLLIARTLTEKICVVTGYRHARA